MSTIRAAITRLDYSPSSYGWLLLNFAAATAEEFERARLAVKNLPYQQRQWIQPARVWRVRASALFTLSAAWPALREALAELGLSGAYGAYGSRYEAPPSLAPGREIAAAFSLLCLTPHAPLELVQAARKVYARLYHPDRTGGDLARMTAINAAADTCETYARAHQAAA